MNVDCVIVFDSSEKLDVDSLNEIKSAAARIIQALHSQSLAHGFSLIKLEDSASGIFCDPTNNLENIQSAIEQLIDRPIINNINLLNYLQEVSKSIGQKVLSLTIFSNGNRDVITDEFLELPMRMEVFFLGPQSCNISALQNQANKFREGDASYCADFIERAKLIEQLQNNGDIPLDHIDNNNDSKLEEEKNKNDQVTVQSQSSAIVFADNPKLLSVPKRAKANNRPPTRKKPTAAASPRLEPEIIEQDPKPVVSPRSAAPPPITVSEVIKKPEISTDKNDSAKSSPRTKPTTETDLNNTANNNNDNTDNNLKSNSDNNEYQLDLQKSAELDPGLPKIRPPSRIVGDINESDPIINGIKQAYDKLWTSYKRSDDDLSDEDSSSYASFSQNESNSQTSEISQENNNQQQLNSNNNTSASKDENSSSGDQSQVTASQFDNTRRVWVKVDTQGIGSSKHTIYQIEILVDGKMITGWKRYSQIRTFFDGLHFSLRGEFGKFPSKSVNKMDTMVIYTRQQYFYKFFTKLYEINRDGVIAFLQAN